MRKHCGMFRRVDSKFIIFNFYHQHKSGKKAYRLQKKTRNFYYASESQDEKWKSQEENVKSLKTNALILRLDQLQDISWMIWAVDSDEKREQKLKFHITTSNFTLNFISLHQERECGWNAISEKFSMKISKYS